MGFYLLFLLDKIKGIFYNIIINQGKEVVELIDWNWVVGVLEDALSQAAANWLTIAITFVVTLLKDWIERLFKGKRKRKHGKRKRRR